MLKIETGYRGGGQGCWLENTKPKPYTSRTNEYSNTSTHKLDYSKLTSANRSISTDFYNEVFTLEGELRPMSMLHVMSQFSELKTTRPFRRTGTFNHQLIPNKRNHNFEWQQCNVIPKNKTCCCLIFWEYVKRVQSLFEPPLKNYVYQALSMTIYILFTIAGR